MGIDLDRAAQTAGVHKSTIFRAIKRGELQASKLQEDGKKPQYFLETADLDAWICARTGRLTEQFARGQDAQNSSPAVQVEQNVGSQPLDLRLALEVAAKTLDQNQELLEHKQQMEAELALERARVMEALERAARAERQAMELQHTLGTYQRALSEQADSLAEERARAQAAELALQAADAPSEPPAEPASAPMTAPAPPPAGWTTRVRRWLLG